jgi:hypothetical protein
VPDLEPGRRVGLPTSLANAVIFITRAAANFAAGQHRPRQPAPGSRCGERGAVWASQGCTWWAGHGDLAAPPPQPSRDGPSGHGPDLAGATASFGSLDGGWDKRAATVAQLAAAGEAIPCTDSGVITPRLHLSGFRCGQSARRTVVGTRMASGNGGLRSSVVSRAGGMTQVSKVGIGRWMEQPRRG